MYLAGMNFHENLSLLGEKEGLKGRKLNKALESFTWNITVLKVLENKIRMISKLSYFMVFFFVVLAKCYGVMMI